MDIEEFKSKYLNQNVITPYGEGLVVGIIKEEAICNILVHFNFDNSYFHDAENFDFLAGCKPFTDSRYRFFYKEDLIIKKPKEVFEFC